jgi:phosphoesterase RecJ-like protein
MTQTTDLKAIADALRQHDRFLVVTHENPDGDALGSLLAATLALRHLGKDAVMYLPGATPLPGEYAFMPLDDLVREAPADAAERVLFAVDCAKAERIGDPAAVERAPLVLDVDHHHDNTRFGAANLVVADASSTAEIVGDLLDALGVNLDASIAQALYVGLVTDTGRFQYANTTPKAFRFAARLEEAGADVNGVFRRVYETVEFAKLKLLARALEHAELSQDGRLLVSYLRRSDFADANAEEPYADGIIDTLRQAAGTEVVALVRETGNVDPGPARKVSLRSSRQEIDVSAIARQRGGGGHRQAAGFSTDESVAELTAFLGAAFRAQAGDGAPAGS